MRRFPDIRFQQINTPLQDGTFRQRIRRIGNQLIMRFVAATLKLLDVPVNHRHIVHTRPFLQPKIPRCFLVQERIPPRFDRIGWALIKSHDHCFWTLALNVRVHPSLGINGAHHFQSEPLTRFTDGFVHGFVGQALVYRHDVVRHVLIGGHGIELPIVEVPPGDEHTPTGLKKWLKDFNMLMPHARSGFRIGNREVLNGLQRDVREMPVIQAFNLPVFRLGTLGKAAFDVAPNHRATVARHIRGHPRQQPADRVEYGERQMREQTEEKQCHGRAKIRSIQPGSAGNSDQSIVRQRHPFRQLSIDGFMEAQLVADVGEISLAGTNF